MNWSKPSPPNETCCYLHSTCDTPFGRFLLTWKDWEEDPAYGFDETPWGAVCYEGWDSVEEAQRWAEEQLRARAEECLKLLG